MSAEPVVVDACGLWCPLPVIRLAAASRDLPPGSVVLLLADDPATRTDVPAWARMRGHAVESVRDTDGRLELRVRLGGLSTDPARHEGPAR